MLDFAGKDAFSQGFLVTIRNIYPLEVYFYRGSFVFLSSKIG